MMDWSDIDDIAIELCERFPQTDPLSVRFTDLRSWVLQLEGFVGEPERCNERILEAIQMAWIRESAP